MITIQQMDKPEKFDNWRDEYEWHSNDAFLSMMELSEDQLLQRVGNRHFDPYFAIWRALRAKGTLKHCAPFMLKTLREQVGRQAMLQRYHCAGALFALMGKEEYPLADLRKRVQWDHEGEAARQAAIDILEEQIREILQAD